MSMANPRKFSEKIALHNQKQAEETAAFERIMQEVSVTRVIGLQPQPRITSHLMPHPQPYLRPYLGGSLPNVNQISQNPQMELHHQNQFDEGKHMARHPARFDSRMRPYTHRRNVMPFELNRSRMGNLDGVSGHTVSPYLSPPPDSSWRSFALSRTNSDSALHQSVMNPNQQDHFNPAANQMQHPYRRDFNEHNFNNMPPNYKSMMENRKLGQYLQAGNRPKSCEAPQRPGDGSNIQMGQTPIPVSVSPSLSHVTQIGNNTGSLPDLSNLHIPSPLSNPIDYDESQHQQQTTPPSQPNSLYNQARSTGNIAAASALPHLGASELEIDVSELLGEEAVIRVKLDLHRTAGMTATLNSLHSIKEIQYRSLISNGIPRGPASPNRSRRHTHNGPSPLSLGSPEHARRIKYPNLTSPKVAGAKPELKSPPLSGGSSGGYSPYPYPGSFLHQSPHAGDGRSWPISPDHSLPPHHIVHQNNTMPPNMNHHQAGQQLRIDVCAASKVGNPQTNPYAHGGLMSSPLTSPTSPTSQNNFSPVTSPRQEFTTGSNPALSEALYRPEMGGSIQPLQHQFERFHMVNEHHSNPPPMYSCLSALNEENTSQGTETAVNNHYNKHIPNSKIPDIIFTGADEVQHPSKMSALIGGADFTGMLPHDDYFPGEELKVNLGLEELQMLEDSNIIADPAMEDSLHLDSL